GAAADATSSDSIAVYTGSRQLCPAPAARLPPLSSDGESVATCTPNAQPVLWYPWVRSCAAQPGALDRHFGRLPKRESARVRALRTMSFTQKKWGPALLPAPTAPSEGSAGVRNLAL